MSEEESSQCSRFLCSLTAVCLSMLLGDNQQMVDFVPSHDIANNVFRTNAAQGWQQGLTVCLMLCTRQYMLKPLLCVVT